MIDYTRQWKPPGASGAAAAKEDDVNRNILVAYATWAGSTAEVALEVAKVLREHGATVEVRPAKEVKDLGPYGAVVLGTAVRMGKLRKDAKQFVERHREALGRMPVAYFLVCLTMKESTEEKCQEAAAFLDPITEMVQPVDVGLFAGSLEVGKLPFYLRMGMKSMEGDFRDWDAIRAWAKGLGPKLAG